MNLIRKIYRRLLPNVFKFTMVIKIAILSILYKNRAYIFGIPIHGNIGDQAIIIAEREFLKKNFPKLKIIEVESSIIRKHIKFLKKLVGNSIIFIHGGGFLGSLWLKEEEMFRTTLKNLPNNDIIVFPQTIYFSNDEEGQEALKESTEIYNNHKHLYICCREKYSFKFIKENFNCNVLLVPDMVLYLSNIKNRENRENILFCIRNDKEKVKYNLNNLINTLEKKYKIEYTDTVIPETIIPLNRKKILLDKLNEFSQYKLIVTDRLHGMVFSLLSNTHCLVLENKNYKVKGVYEWIESYPHIKLYNDSYLNNDFLENFITSDIATNHKEIIKNYKSLIELIGKNIQ